MLRSRVPPLHISRPTMRGPGVLLQQGRTPPHTLSLSGWEIPNTYTTTSWLATTIETGLDFAGVKSLQNTISLSHPSSVQGQPLNTTSLCMIPMDEVISPAQRVGRSFFGPRKTMTTRKWLVGAHQKEQEPFIFPSQKISDTPEVCNTLGLISLIPILVCSGATSAVYAYHSAYQFFQTQMHSHGVQPRPETIPTLTPTVMFMVATRVPVITPSQVYGADTTLISGEGTHTHTLGCMMMR